MFKNPDIECGSTEHVLLSIWSALTFVVLLVFIYLRANGHDILQHDPRSPARLRDDIHNFDAYYAFFRLFAMIILIVVAEASPITASILLMIAFLIPVAFTIHKLVRHSFLFHDVIAVRHQDSLPSKSTIASQQTAFCRDEI